MPRPFATFSVLLLLAASPAFGADAHASAKDSQGNSIRSVGGACVGSTIGSGKSDKSCAKTSTHQTFRILQGMIPQPTVTYVLPPPAPPVETVVIALNQPWETGSAMLSPTQREELYAVMAQLEAYRRIESFEVVTYPGEAKDAGSNHKLAEQRAKALRGFLASVGVPSGQIVYRVADPASTPRSELNVTVRGRR